MYSNSTTTPTWMYFYHFPVTMPKYIWTNVTNLYFNSLGHVDTYTWDDLKVLEMPVIKLPIYRPSNNSPWWIDCSRSYSIASHVSKGIYTSVYVRTTRLSKIVAFSVDFSTRAMQSGAVFSSVPATSHFEFAVVNVHSGRFLTPLCTYIWFFLI